ncbi:MAG: hypothetical protein WD717_07765 [Nitrosarchaeum sp.]
MKEGKYFWRGIKYNISPCCITFFENEWQLIRKDNKEYGKTMHKLTNNQGIIMCPECLTNHIEYLQSKT